MGKPSIKKGSDYMFNVKWIGNGRGQRVGTFLPFTDNGTIAKSCIFEPNNYLYRSIPGTATNVDKCSLSLWFKPTVIADNFGFLGTNGGTLMQLYFQTSNNLRLYDANGTDLITQRTFEDQSKFYHLMIVWDTAQSTASNRIKFYVDGDQLTEFSTATYPSQNADVSFNNSAQQLGRINLSPSGNYYYDGYMAEVNFADGQAYSPSDFGLTDTSTGRWIPKSLSGISYGNNGFRLQFATNSNLGDDTSTVGSDFTSSSLDTHDQSTDSPTQNFANMGGRIGGSITVSEGNLKTTVGAADTHVQSSIPLPLTGKWYWEVRLVTLGGYERIGIVPNYASTSYHPFTEGIAFNRMGTDDGLYMQGVDQGTAWDGAFHAGDIVGFAVDMDNKIFYISDNGTYRNSANPANVTGGLSFAGTTLASNNAQLHAATGSGNSGSTNVSVFNFGQNPTFSGAITAGTETPDSGPGLFKYDPPTGFSALCQDNFPETTKGKPDFVWIKDRSNSYNHELYDTTRGPLNRLTAESDVEDQINDGLQKFLKGGFSIEDRPGLNTNASKYISWNWVANGGTTSANTDGSGATIASTIQANQTAGFSIITYTGNGTSGAKVAHGLTQAPDWIISGCRSASQSKAVYHSGVTNAEQYYGRLDLSDGFADHTGPWNDTAPTNKVITLGNGGWVNDNSQNYVLWCWHAVEGYSAFGSYYTDGNVDGPFIYTGFKPKWMMIKASGAISWYIMDNERSLHNPVKAAVNSDSNAAEHTNQINTDFLSNGFKVRASGSYVASQNSASHDPYYYMAFAEHPFHGNGVNPVTAG